MYRWIFLHLSEGRILILRTVDMHSSQQQTGGQHKHSVDL